MGKYYVDRDAQNNINGIYKNKQYVGQERIDETHPDVIAYINSQQVEIEKANKLSEINGYLIDLFKFIDELFVVGKQKGLWVNSDFSPEALQNGQAWRQKIDEYEAM